MHTFASYLITDRQEGPVQRDIALALASYNIGVVAEKVYSNGVTAFVRKAYMFADGFNKKRLLVVGLQGCRSKERGTSQICDYHMIISYPKS